MTVQEDLRAAVALLGDDPLAAADLFDALAGRLRTAAEQLRSVAHAARAPGGMGDRVKISVRGPNGEEVRSVDTGRVDS